MITSLYPEGDGPWSGLMTNSVNSDLGVVLCEVALTKSDRPIDKWQLSMCEWYGIIFLDDEDIGFFFMIKNEIELRMHPNYNKDEIKIEIYDMILSNIEKMKSNISINNTHISAKQKRVSVFN